MLQFSCVSFERFEAFLISICVQELPTPNSRLITSLLRTEECLPQTLHRLTDGRATNESEFGTDQEYIYVYILCPLGIFLLGVANTVTK